MANTGVETAAHRSSKLMELHRHAAWSAGTHGRKMMVGALAAPMFIFASNASAQSVSNPAAPFTVAGNPDAGGDSSASPTPHQESTESPQSRTGERSLASDDGGDWKGFIGLAGVARPLYDGSSETTVSPFPLLQVTWRNRIELGPGGLSVLFSNTPSLRIGAGLTFDPGRDEQDGRAIFSNGDAEKFLRGMGDVKARPGLRVFGATGLGPVMLHASVAKYFADDNPLVPQNDGVLGEIGVALPLMRTEKLRVAARLDATVADQSYMQAFFGVTPW